ncbi:MAG TPA: hypothetical protein P5081_07810 [Phycisphaerae bacterium]|nr:hypothetical protein [Phycisphaerae bacterium]HRW52777.1 hypothetical protein [Phycisphaerae bacterium]
MNPDDHNNDWRVPPTTPPGARDASPMEYMVGQIRVMRLENPEIWKRIDELTDGNFDATKYANLLIAQKSDCERCGYNLYGNTSGVCPECGTPVHGSIETRRLLSIRIFDALRTQAPEKWSEVAARLESERREAIEREFTREGSRRDEIRRKALQSWLDRKRGESGS